MPDHTVKKTCSMCKVTKDSSEFRIDRSTKDGLTHQCRACRSARDAAYRAANREVIKPKDRARVARWRAANPGAGAAYTRKWAAKNPELAKRKSATWKAENPDQVKALSIKWRQANPEKYRQSHAEQERRRRARRRKVQVERVNPMLVWDGICGICKRPLDHLLAHPDPMSKSVDHIIPLARGGTHALGNIQWAHLVCNTAKGAKLPDAS